MYEFFIFQEHFCHVSLLLLSLCCIFSPLGCLVLFQIHLFWGAAFQKLSLISCSCCCQFCVSPLETPPTPGSWEIPKDAQPYPSAKSQPQAPGLTCSRRWSAAGWWCPHRRRWSQWVGWWPTGQSPRTWHRPAGRAQRWSRWNTSGSAGGTGEVSAAASTQQPMHSFIHHQLFSLLLNPQQSNHSPELSFQHFPWAPACPLLVITTGDFWFLWGPQGTETSPQLLSWGGIQVTVLRAASNPGITPFILTHILWLTNEPGAHKAAPKDQQLGTP